MPFLRNNILLIKLSILTPHPQSKLARHTCLKYDHITVMPWCGQYVGCDETDITDSTF